MDRPAVVIRDSTPADGAAVVALWERAVDATHDFLTVTDRAEIGLMVRDFLPAAPLRVAVDGDDRPIAFMLADGGHMAALFVDPAHHGRGVGRALVADALAACPTLTTDVNEQNAGALAFYERLGFRRTGRSPLDDDGRPYPLIRLRFDGVPAW